MIPSESAVRPGVLYLVSTPIGNLEDVSLRAIKILSGVGLIAAEDTRKTRILLDRYGIRRPLLSYHSYNEVRRVPEIMEKLKRGMSVALVSDAGTPGISDPAERIVRSAIGEGIPVTAIPGPTAFLTALIVSGLPADKFTFEGFLPAKKGRTSMLQALSLETRTIVLYESPHRLLRTLRDLQLHLGDRDISVCRELTKKFEEVVRGKLSQVLSFFSAKAVRGEFVLVIRGKTGAEDPDSPEAIDP